jgi:hypothetical protein
MLHNMYDDQLVGEENYERYNYNNYDDQLAGEENYKSLQ